MERPRQQEGNLDPLEKRGVLDHLQERLEGAHSRCQAAWDRAAENEKWTAGLERAQWDKDAADKRDDTGRPVLTVNNIILAINAVSGRPVVGASAPSFEGEDGSQGDRAFAAACEKFARRVRKRGRFDRTIRLAFRRAMIQNIAWTERWQNYSVPPVGVGRTELSAVPLWEMMWGESIEPNLRTRMWDARGRWVDIEELYSQFPESESDIKEAVQSRHLWVAPKSEKTVDAYTRWPFLYQNEDDGAGRAGRYVDINARRAYHVSYHWRERVHHFLVAIDAIPVEGGVAAIATAVSNAADPNADGTDELVEALLGEGADGGRDLLHLGPKSFKLYEEIVRDLTGARPSADGYVVVPQWEHRWADVLGNGVLLREGTHPAPMRQAITAFSMDSPDEQKLFGVVDLMRDPQRALNVMTSMFLSLVQNSSKEPTFYEPEAFKEPDKLAELAASPSPFIPLATGGKDKLLFGKPLTFPPGLDRFLELLDQALWRPVGFTPQTLGQIADLRRVSGSTFRQVQDAIGVVLSFLYDNLTLYLEDSGRLDLECMRYYYDRDDVVRVIGVEAAEGPVKIDANGEPMFDEAGLPVRSGAPPLPPREAWEAMVDFDVTVDAQPSGPEGQQEWWDYITRTGSLDRWLDQGLVPMELVVSWVAGLSASDRAKWLEHLEARKRAVAAANAAAEQEGGMD